MNTVLKMMESDIDSVIGKAVKYCGLEFNIGYTKKDTKSGITIENEDYTDTTYYISDNGTGWYPVHPYEYIVIVG